MRQPQVIKEPLQPTDKGLARTCSYYSPKHDAMLDDYQKYGRFWCFDKLKEYFNEGHLQLIVAELCHFDFNFNYRQPGCQKNGNHPIVYFFSHSLPKILEAFEIVIPHSSTANQQTFENRFTWLMTAQFWLSEVMTPLLEMLKEDLSVSKVGATSQKIKQHIDHLQLEITQCRDPIEKENLIQVQASLQAQADELDAGICNAVATYIKDIKRYIRRWVPLYFQDGIPPSDKVNLDHLQNEIRGFPTERYMQEDLTYYIKKFDLEGKRFSNTFMIETNNPLGGTNYFYPFAIGLICHAQRELFQDTTHRPFFDKIAHLFVNKSPEILEGIIRQFNFKNMNTSFLEEFATVLRETLIKLRLGTLDTGFEKKGFSFGDSALSYIANLFWYYYDGSGKHHMENPAYLDEVSRTQIIKAVEVIKENESNHETMVEQPKKRAELTTKGLWLLVAYLIDRVNPQEDEIVLNRDLIINPHIFNHFYFAQLHATFLYFYQLSENSTAIAVSNTQTDLSFLDATLPEQSDIFIWYNRENPRLKLSYLPPMNNKEKFIQEIKHAVLLFRRLEKQGEKLVHFVKTDKVLSPKGVRTLKSHLLLDIDPITLAQYSLPHTYQNALIPHQDIHQEMSTHTTTENGIELDTFAVSNNTNNDLTPPGAQKNNCVNADAVRSARINNNNDAHAVASKSSVLPKDNNENTTAESPLLARKDNTNKSSKAVPNKSYYGTLQIKEDSRKENTPSPPQLLAPPLLLAKKHRFNITYEDIRFLAQEYFNIQIFIHNTLYRRHCLPLFFGNHQPVIHIRDQAEGSLQALIDPFPQCRSRVSDTIHGFCKYMTTSHLTKTEIINVFNTYITNDILLQGGRLFSSSYKPQNALAKQVVQMCQKTEVKIADIINFLKNNRPPSKTMDREFLDILDYIFLRYNGKSFVHQFDDNSLPPPITHVTVPRRASPSG